MNVKQGWKDFFTGITIGGTMSVPGVSGGTMAMAMGYYPRVLHATANLRLRENLSFLFRFGIGGILGFFLLAKMLGFALKLLPLTMTLIFLGAVGAGIWILGKQTLAQGFSFNGGLFFLLGILMVFSMDKLPTVQGAPLMLTLIWGVFLAVGIILPGISTSHLLLIFGLYETVSDFSVKNLPVLLMIGSGAVVGILVLTKPLSLAMDRFPLECNCALLGFAVGSVKNLIEPCLFSSQITYLLPFQIINGFILGTGAAWGIVKMNRVEKKMKKL